MARIELLENEGINLHRPYADLLKDGIHELRAKVSDRRYRILYFFSSIGKTIVLTHGVVKTTRRMPEAEINRAKRYREDWQARERRNK